MTERILVMAPHPDDEVIACASVLDLHRLGKAEVTVAFFTAGEGAMDVARREGWTFDRAGSQGLGERRMEEAARALEVWGIDDYVLIGAPDGFVRDMRRGFSHPFFDRVPFRDSLMFGRRYEWNALVRAVKRLLRDGGFRLVYLPSPMDSHPDHKEVGVLAMGTLHDRRTGRVFSVSRITSDRQELASRLLGQARVTPMKGDLLARKKKSLSRYSSQSYLFDNVNIQCKREIHWRLEPTAGMRIASVLLDRYRTRLHPIYFS